MEELLAVVADEVRALGIDALEHVGAYPPSSDDDVYVVVPHEYFVVTPPRSLPTSGQMQRTIGFAVEHPGNDTFEVSARWCAQLGAVVDINDDSSVELRRRGIPAHRFHLGYSARWDCWGRDANRDRNIDVTYLGTTEGRRSRALASFGESLIPWNVRLLMPPHEPMTKPRPDFLMGSDKFRHLSSSKVLINLHRGLSRSLEWVRVLEAVCNGCVVVSEHSIDYLPLVPGEHVLFGDARSLGEIAAAVLRDDEWRRSLSVGAYDFVRSELTMESSAQRMIDIAERLVAGRGSMPPETKEKRTNIIPRLALRDFAVAEPDTSLELPTQVASSMIHRVREQETCSDAPVFSLGVEPGEALVDVLIATVDERQSVTHATDRVLNSSDLAIRVLSTRNACRAATSETGQRGSHEAGGLRAASLNRLLSAAIAPYVFIVDPNVDVFDGCIDRLVAALDQDDGPTASLAMFVKQDGTIGNALPFEPTRLARQAYLGSTALWRRESLVDLGGWNERFEISGYEDHELWMRLASAGRTATLVSQVLARHRSLPIVPLDARTLMPDASWAAARAV